MLKNVHLQALLSILLTYLYLIHYKWEGQPRNLIISLHNTRLTTLASAIMQHAYKMQPPLGQRAVSSVPMMAQRMIIKEDSTCVFSTPATTGPEGFLKRRFTAISMAPVENESIPPPEAPPVSLESRVRMQASRQSKDRYTYIQIIGRIRAVDSAPNRFRPMRQMRSSCKKPE